MPLRTMRSLLVTTLVALACTRTADTPPSSKVQQPTKSSESTSSTTNDPVDPETGIEITCDFYKRYAHPQPDSLIAEFVARAAAGAFAGSEDWLPTAVDCPGHEPGYDSFGVVRRFALERLDARSGQRRYALTREFIGSYFASGFQRDSSVIVVDTITVDSTKFGWRIQSQAAWAWIDSSHASQKGWLSGRAP